MKGRSGMSSTLPNLSLNSLNISTKVGISQSSFNKFNKTMHQLNKPVVSNPIVRKYNDSPLQDNKNPEKSAINNDVSNDFNEKGKENALNTTSRQIYESSRNEGNSVKNSTNDDDYLLKIFKEKRKKNFLTTINIQNNLLTNYKYVPPRRPRYIQCINNSNKPNNFSKSLPPYKKSNFDNTDSDNHASKFGDPSHCYCKMQSLPRTPALPLRMKIKMDARESDRGENERRESDSKSTNKNVQSVALKYFCECGNEIGCFSKKVPVRFPESEKQKIKKRLRNSCPNQQPNPLNSSPRSMQSRNLFSSFLSLS